MRNIYELTSDYLAVQELIEQGEFDAEVLADTLQGIEDEMEIKAENYGLVMKNIEALSNGVKAEIERLTAYKKQLDQGVASMKENLSKGLLAAEKTKFKTDHFAFSFRKSETVNVIDQNLVPVDYIKVKTKETVDKTALKKALKNGLETEGATIVEKQNLQIK